MVDYMRVTITSLLHFLLIKINYVIFDLRNFLFDADQNGPFSLLTYLRHTIFLHWDRQLSWRFYAFMQFWYSKIGRFHDNFWTNNIIFTPRKASVQMVLCLQEDTQFLSGGYFTFSRYPMKKTDSINQRSTVYLVRNSKNLKMAKNHLS